MISRLIESARDRAAGRRPEPLRLPVPMIPMPVMMKMTPPRSEEDGDGTDDGKKDCNVKIAMTLLKTLSVTKDVEFSQVSARSTLLRAR